MTVDAALKAYDERCKRFNEAKPEEYCYIKDPLDGRYCSNCLADIPFCITWGDRCPECGRMIAGFRDYDGYNDERQPA